VQRLPGGAGAAARSLLRRRPGSDAS